MRKCLICDREDSLVDLAGTGTLCCSRHFVHFLDINVWGDLLSAQSLKQRPLTTKEIRKVLQL